MTIRHHHLYSLCKYLLNVCAGAYSSCTRAYYDGVPLRTREHAGEHENNVYSESQRADLHMPAGQLACRVPLCIFKLAATLLATGDGRTGLAGAKWPGWLVGVGVRTSNDEAHPHHTPKHPHAAARVRTHSARVVAEKRYTAPHAAYLSRGSRAPCGDVN